MSATYYVLSSDGTQQMPSISTHNDLADAIHQFDEWIDNFSEPVLLQQIEPNRAMNEQAARERNTTTPAQGTTLLWSDERISSFSGNAPTAWEARRMFDAMKRVRDEYEAERVRLIAEAAALRAELADTLLVSISRGDRLDYYDVTERARYTELTGKEYEEEE